MPVASHFAGIGGLERGTKMAWSHYACEWWKPAQAVLQHRFLGVELDGDITTVSQLPDADIVVGGFPCTDVSRAGGTVVGPRAISRSAYGRAGPR